MRRRGSIALIGLVAACSLSAGGPGCRQIAGISDPVAAEPIDACTSCSENGCRAELAGCRASADCSKAWSCLAACAPGDDACRATCRADLGGSFSHELAVLQHCQHAACEIVADCGKYVYSSASCAACLEEKCAGPLHACVDELACIDRRYARIRCSTPGTCGTCSSPAGDGSANDCAAVNCQGATCATECGAWECLGRPTQPLAAGPTVDLELTFVDAFEGSLPPLAGLAVRACRRTDPGCTQLPPVSESLTTGADGSVTLPLPTQDPSGALTGFAGFVEVTGAALVRPYRLEWSRRVNGPRHITVRLLSAAHGADALSLLGVTDDKMSSLELMAEECGGAPVAGVAFAVEGVSDPRKIVYLRNYTVDPSASSTDATGIGFVADVPIDPAIGWREALVDVFPDPSTQAASTHAQIWARSGTITLAELAPTQ